MAPPFDAGPVPGETPEEKQARLLAKMRADREARASIANISLDPEPEPVPAPGYRDAADTRLAPRPTPRDATASPPIVPQNTTRSKPYGVPDPSEISGSPWANFATVPSPRESAEASARTVYPGVNLGPEAGRSPVPDVAPDAAAAIQASVARHESAFGTGRLGPEDAPAPFSKPPAGGIPMPEEEDGYLERLGRGLMSRGGDYASGFTQVFSDATQAVAGVAGDNMAGHALQSVSDFLQGIGNTLDDIQSESYRPKYDDVEKAIEEAKQGNFGYILGYMAEQAPLTIADLVFSVAGAPIYITSTAGDFAKERAANDGRDQNQLTFEDYAYGTSAAIASYVIEKATLGTGKIGKSLLGQDVMQQIADFGTSNVFKRIVKSGTRGVVGEAAEEASQEALVTVDTEKGFSAKGTALAGAGGALAGGPATVAIDAVTGRYRPQEPTHETGGMTEEGKAQYDRLYAEGERIGREIDAAKARGAPAEEIKALQDQLGAITKIMREGPAGGTGAKTGVSPDAKAAIEAAGGKPAASGRTPPVSPLPFAEGAEPAPPPGAPFAEGGPPASYPEGQQPSERGAPYEGGIPLPPEETAKPYQPDPSAVQEPLEESAFEEETVTIPGEMAQELGLLPEGAEVPEFFEVPATMAHELGLMPVDGGDDDELSSGIPEGMTAAEAAEAGGGGSGVGETVVTSTGETDVVAPYKEKEWYEKGYIEEPKRVPGERDEDFDEKLRLYREEKAKDAEAEAERAKARSIYDTRRMAGAVHQQRRGISEAEDTAAAKYLQTMETSRQVGDGVRSNRDDLAQMYDNLSDLARVQADKLANVVSNRAKTKSLEELMLVDADRKAWSRLHEDMLDNAVSMSQARADVMDLASADMQGPGFSPRGMKNMTPEQRAKAIMESLSPFDRANARFGMVDPKLLQVLGLDPDILSKAAAGSDPAALHDAINTVRQKAHGAIQGRAKAELPKAGQRDRPVRLSKKEAAVADVVHEASKGPPGARRPAGVDVAKAESLRYDIRRYIYDENGERILNPDFKKKLDWSKLSEDEKEEIHALEAEELEVKERGQGFEPTRLTEDNSPPARRDVGQARAKAKASYDAAKKSADDARARVEKASKAFLAAGGSQESLAAPDDKLNAPEPIELAVAESLAPQDRLRLREATRKLKDIERQRRERVADAKKAWTALQNARKRYTLKALAVPKARWIALGGKSTDTEPTTAIAHQEALTAEALDKANKDLASIKARIKSGPKQIKIAKAWDHLQQARRDLADAEQRLRFSEREVNTLNTHPVEKISVGKESAFSAGARNKRGTKLEGFRAEETRLKESEGRRAEGAHQYEMERDVASEVQALADADERERAREAAKTKDDIEKEIEEAKRAREAGKARDLELAAERLEKYEALKAKAAAKQAAYKERGGNAQYSPDLTPEELEALTGVPPKMTAEEKRFARAVYQLKTYENDVKANRHEGRTPQHLAKLKVMAKVIWHGRRDPGTVGKGVWVRFNNEGEEDYRLVRAAQPARDPDALTQHGVQRRYKGLPVRYKGRVIMTYRPDQVESHDGWRFGWTTVPAYNSSPFREATENLKDFPANVNLEYSTEKVDALVTEIMGQIPVDPSIARIMADILINREKNASSGSGTRGRNAGTRAPRRELEGEGLRRKTFKRDVTKYDDEDQEPEEKPKQDEGGATGPGGEGGEGGAKKDDVTPGKREQTILEPGTKVVAQKKAGAPWVDGTILEYDEDWAGLGPAYHVESNAGDKFWTDPKLVRKSEEGEEGTTEDTAPVPEAKPMTEEEIEEFQEVLKKAAKLTGKKAEQDYVSFLANRKERIQILSDQIATAEGLQPKMAAEISTITDARYDPDWEASVMTYDAEEAGIGWPAWPRDSWTAIERDGAIHDAAIDDLEPIAGTGYGSYHRQLIDSIERTIQGQRRMLAKMEKELDDARKSWASGGGRNIEGSRKAGTSRADRPDILPSTGEPGARRAVDVAISETHSVPEREPIDLYAGVDREPFGEDSLLHDFKYIGHRGPVVDGKQTFKTGPYPVSTAQMSTAQRILHGFKQRMLLLARGDQWADSVNRAGMLVSSGTGSGKSAIIAMSAYSIYERQPKGSPPKQVVIVHQPNYPASVRGGFVDVGLDPDDHRFKIVDYDNLSRLRGEYAAVLFDEAHWQKSPVSGKDYAVAAGKIKAPFRVFFTATPTDLPLQELYYLRYMRQETEEPISLAGATQRVRTDLGLGSATDTKEIMRRWLSQTGRVERYARELDSLIRAAAANNAAVSYALPPVIRSKVNPIPDDMIEPIAAAAALLPENQANETVMRRLNEHMKLKFMVRRTLDQIKNGKGGNWGVLSVFHFSNPPEGAKVFGPSASILNQPAMLRFEKMLNEQAEIDGIDVRAKVLKGSAGISGAGMKDIADKFRDGRYNVVIMNDGKGSTGVDFDDFTGGNPKLTLVAGVSAVGQDWLQLQGRTDRQSTKSVPHIEYIAIEGFKPDTDMRELIKTKVFIQEGATGSLLAMESSHPGLEPWRNQPTPLHKQLRKQSPGAPAPHSSPIDGMVSERLSEGPVTASSIVGDIARNETDPALAELAQALVGHPALAGIQVQSWWGAPLPKADPTQPDGPSSFGAVLGYAQGRGAYVNVGSGSEAITALHEVIHHVTHRAIDSNPVIRARLQAIMNVVPHELAPMFEGVLTDPHEFVATAFSDPAFQRALKGIKAPSGATLWQRFKELVRAVIGARSKDLSAFDAVLELKLLDPGTVTEHGSGDVSTQLETAMQRRRMSSGAVRGAADLLSDQKDPAFQKLLATMTHNQITQSWGGLSTDKANTKKPGGVNHLQAIESIIEARYALTNRERHIFDKKVLSQLQTWAQDPNGGRRMISVQMRKGQPFVKMTAMQYLAEVMNLSGYARVHFGKPDDADENSILQPPKDPAKYERYLKRTGKAARGRDRSHAIWDQHKKQFDTVLGQGGRDVYNGIADYFKEQADQVSVLVAQQFLDMTAPRKDGLKWHAMPPSEVRKRIKELGGLSDEELKANNLQRPALHKIAAILDPGRVPGAYFPLKRNGEWVVTVKQKVKYADDADKGELLARYLGAKDNPNTKELTYYSVSRFERESEGEAYRERAEKEFPDATVSNVMLASDTGFIKDTSLSDTLVKAYMDRVDAQVGISAGDKEAQKSLFVQAVIDLMPEASFADTWRPREGVLGAGLDILRNLNAYGSGLSHYKGAAAFATQHREALRDFQKYLFALENGNAADAAKARKLRRISNELGKRASLTASAFSEQRWAQSLNNVGFAYHLVGASYNVLNMSQVPLMTAPHLAGRHGMAATSMALARAYRVAGGGPLYKLAKTGMSVTTLKGLLPGLRRDFDRKNYDVLTDMIEGMERGGDQRHASLLKALSERNMIDATVAMDMAAGARTSHVDKHGNLRRQTRLGYLTDWMKMAPHITEVMNRAVTAVAAFDLEYAKLTRAGADHKTATQKATDYAAQVINDTQFNYQTWNKPRILQGNGWARVLLMFKQHPQHVYYFMVNRAIRSSAGLRAMAQGRRLTQEEREDARTAMKQLAYFVGMHAMAVGAIGSTPEPIKWIIGMLSALFGDDEPFDFELWMQNSMYDWLGEEYGQVAARGLPTLAGVDLSSRIGIDSLMLFDTPDPSTPDSFMADVFRTIGGPIAGLGERAFYTAPTAIANGEYTKAIEAMTPKAIRDPIRAYRTSVEGYTTYAGRVYSEPNQIGPLEIFLTSLGFTPSSTSLMYLSQEVDSQVDIMSSKKTALMKRAYYATSDVRAFNDAFREIVRWNADNPVYAISKKELIKHFKGRARNQENTHGGMLVPEKYRPWADYQNRFRGIPREVTPG